jgi:hypothetical protein
VHVKKRVHVVQPVGQLHQNNERLLHNSLQKRAQTKTGEGAICISKGGRMLCSLPASFTRITNGSSTTACKRGHRQRRGRGGYACQEAGACCAARPPA